ncbi:MAG: hypothetical protein RL491_1328 [Bacteroidota bacterium]
MWTFEQDAKYNQGVVPTPQKWYIKLKKYTKAT